MNEELCIVYMYMSALTVIIAIPFTQIVFVQIFKSRIRRRRLTAPALPPPWTPSASGAHEGAVPRPLDANQHPPRRIRLVPRRADIDDLVLPLHHSPQTGQRRRETESRLEYPCGI